MKQPKAYRIEDDGRMIMRPVLEVEFQSDGSVNFHIGGVGWFQQRGNMSIPGMLSDSAKYQNSPYRIFESEAEAWAFEIESLYAKKDKLHKEIDAIVCLIYLAVQNLAQVKESQNETKPPK